MAEHETNLTETEKEQVEQHSPPASKVVHAAVSKQGDDELDRPVGSLFWSAIAAGVSIMASLWVSGALHSATPDGRWQQAVSALGYPVGFIIVVLGRMQLFTEQTLVAVLPFARAKTWYNFKRVARLWTVVFIGNLIGTAAVSMLAAHGYVQPEHVLRGMVAVAAKLQEHTAWETFALAIPAGFIMAAVAWVHSAEDHTGVLIVLVLTLAIGLCAFTHVIVGAAEAWLLLWTGHASIGWVLAGFLFPALAGNIVGGTGLFAVLTHAQVQQEI